MLNLRNVSVLLLEENEDSYVIHAESVVIIRDCPECRSTDSVVIGKRIQRYVDTQMHAKTVRISFTRKRLKCKACGKTYFEPLAWLHEDFRMPIRTVDYVVKRAAKVPFLSVASELGVDEKTIRNVFANYVTAIENKHDWQAPRVLGIDETHFSQKMHLVMTDIEKRTLLDMRKDRSQDATQKAIMRLRGWKNIEIVCIDMWRPYYRAVKQLIPNTVVVVDRFHVAKMAGEAMEKARKAVRAELTVKERKKLKNDRKILLKRRDNIKGLNELVSFEFWTNEYPQLMEVYNAKEGFLGMWDMPTRKEAEDYWENWKSVATPTVRKYFSDAIRAIDNWHEEIFNWWDYPYTNAVTESLNNSIKGTFRNGRGYSFEVLRAKLLYTKGGLETTIDSLNQPRPEPNEMILIDEPEMSFHGFRHDMVRALFEQHINHPNTHKKK
ncbi:transposase [Vibrio crassostreae]|nr:transposase [Vibrio crassostreae]CAK2977289.1 transposase [Vibrio crassostreae]CAK3472563.1 transposase [Vibrio crassostreae]CAK3566074.1 transposase [Vibrio crassostreae]CAK3592568.1 transposase [Vibrio crassostreae]